MGKQSMCRCNRGACNGYLRVYFVVLVGIVFHGLVRPFSYSVFPCHWIMFHGRDIHTGQPVSPHGLVQDSQAAEAEKEAESASSRA